MPFGMYISNVTCTAYVHNIMSVSSPLFWFQVQVGPVITTGECTVGGCSDWSMSGCSYVTLQMDRQGVNKCWQLILSTGFGPVHTDDGVYIMLCHVMLACVCASEFLNCAHRLLFLYGRSLRGNRGGWGKRVSVSVCVCVCVCVCVVFFIIYCQHAPLHWYAILHACFIIYSSIVSVTLITLDYNCPFHNLSKSIEFVNSVKYFKYLFIS